MSQAEADDIAANGFRPDPTGRSMEGKWFSATKEGAEQFKEKLGADQIVETWVPREVWVRSFKHENIDGTGPGFCVDCADLPLLPRPE